MSGSGTASQFQTRAGKPGQEAGKPAVFLMTNDLRTGGSERQFTGLAQSLNREAFQVLLGCLRRRGALLAGFEDIAEFDLGGSFLTLQAQRARVALARHLRAQRVAVAHSFDFYTNLMLIPVARLAGVPVVIGSQRQIGDLLTPLQFGVQGALFRLCDRVVCNSRAAARRLLDQGLPEHKVVIILNGLRKEAFAETAPALPRSPGLVRIGMIARMNHPCKNHGSFLRAAARLAPRFPAAEFLLVGDGPLRPQLEDMAARLGLGHRARFLGERHDIPAVLAATDILVSSSLSESLSNVILESMAAGVPLVATRVGGNPEVVVEGETGLLVPPDDEEELVAAVERLLTEPALRKKCSRRAKDLALAHFTMDQMRHRHEQLYADLLLEKGCRLDTPRLESAAAEISSRPVRVAIVAPTLRWVGGQAVQADLLIRHWKNDPLIQACFIPMDPEVPRWIRCVERVPYLRTVVRALFNWAALWRGIKDTEIVHIFSASYWAFLLVPVPAWLMARLRGKKTLINYHSGEARDHLRRWRSAKPVLMRADRLVVPSQYLVDVFREFHLDAHAVPNIVDLSLFSYRPRQPLRPRLVCTRGFHLYYSVDLVVRAFAQIKEEFPSAHLCLVGEGPLEGKIRTLVREMKLNDIEFTGPVSREKIGHFYEQADIFINASWLDNMPLSILEAFASGTAVVSTAPEGIQYLVEHERTGLLCAPGDWKALAENVRRLLRHPDLATRLASNAYEESRRYCWEAVRSLWLEVYRSMWPSEARTETVSEQSPSPAAPPGTLDLAKKASMDHQVLAGSPGS